MTIGGLTAVRSRSAQISIDFSGGTVAQFVAQLGNAESGPYSVIGEKAFQEMSLPPMALHGLDPYAVTSALSILLRPQAVSVMLAGSNVIVLTKATPSVSLNPQPIPTFQAFQLAPYLATLSIDDITDAISVAWQSIPAHDAKPLAFKFHPATKLLFVYGPPDAILLAAQVIPQLNPTATSRARYEYLSKPAPESGAVLSPAPAEEQARLDFVAQEVRRRRQIREAGGKESAPLPPEKK
jgi:hypothetical protein